MYNFRFSISLGTIPSIHLASKSSYSNLCAIIFLSPIGSGIKLVNPKMINSFDDLEKIKPININRNLQDISCSVWLIHGSKDTVIPPKYTEEMHKKLSKAICWFPKEGDHSNILTHYRDKFFTKCLFFINNLKYYATKDIEASAYSPPALTNILNIKPSQHGQIKLLENYVKNTSSIPNDIPITINMIPNSGFSLSKGIILGNSDKINTKLINNSENYGDPYNFLNSNTTNKDVLQNSNLTLSFTTTVNNQNLKNNNIRINKKHNSKFDKMERIEKFGGKSFDSKYLISENKHDAYIENDDDSDNEFETNYKNQEKQYDLIKNNI